MRASLRIGSWTYVQSPSRRGGRLRGRPGAALGSTRRKLAEGDLAAVMEFIARRGITHYFMIGGDDSAETALAISSAARGAGLDLSVMHVPKTVDNDLAETDHTPGYGSAARFTAAAVQGAGRDAEAMGAAAPVTGARGCRAKLRMACRRIGRGEAGTHGTRRTS